MARSIHLIRNRLSDMEDMSLYDIASMVLDLEDKAEEHEANIEELTLEIGRLECELANADD